MAQYQVLVNATSNATANTEETYIEILPPANVSVILTALRLSLPHTTVLDVPCEIRVLRTSTGGATGTSFTPTKTRVASPASVSTVVVKNGTNAFTVGTIVDQLRRIAFNSRGVIEWVARDEYDKIESGVNQRLIITGKINNASTVFDCECSFEE